MINDAASGPPAQDSKRITALLKRAAASVLEAIKSNSFLPAGETPARKIVAVTDWMISLSLVLYAVFAPHSIAITQGSYLLGLIAWIVQLTLGREFRPRRTPVDVALFGFFACCVLSSFFSYDALVSIKGLKSPAFFLAFYFVCNNVRSVRFASFLGLLIVVSCLVNVGYSGLKLASGRGLRIDAISSDSPFAGEIIKPGDVLLEADDERVNSREDLLRIIDSQRGRLRIKLQRNETFVETSISRRAVRDADGDGFERLGITTSPGRNFRLTGFYSHYETYAEVLQLIAALAIGMLIVIPRKRSPVALFLFASVPLLVLTLILTSTRAALAGLSVAVAVMAIVNSHRRVLVVAMSAVLVALPLGLIAIEHARGISIFDPEEGSTAYRLEVWREGLRIIKDNPLLGIGKGSEGKLKDSLGLYDDGRLPPGHFHSTPVQIAVWWGLAALIFYYSFMAIFALTTLRMLKEIKQLGSWEPGGIALGALGAFVAFNVSSFVHFNFGDGEVVMAFWLLTGLAYAVRKMSLQSRDVETLARKSVPPSKEGSHRSQHPAPAATFEPSVRAAKAKQN